MFMAQAYQEKRISLEACRLKELGLPAVEGRGAIDHQLFMDWTKVGMRNKSVYEYMEQKSPSVGLLIGDAIDCQGGHLVRVGFEKASQWEDQESFIFFPKSNFRFGRAENTHSQNIYVCDGDLRQSYQFLDGINDNVLIEVQSSTGIVWTPPSSFPGGEYEWSAKGAPTRIPANTLIEGTTMLAIAYLLDWHVHESMPQLEVTAAVAGVLARAGVDRRPARDIVSISNWAGDDKTTRYRRRDTVSRVYRRMDAGKNVPNAGDLERFLGATVTARIIEWLGRLAF